MILQQNKRETLKKPLFMFIKDNYLVFILIIY